MTGDQPKRVKVRTTIRPDQELEVSHQESLDLKRQGLLVEKTPEMSPDLELEKEPVTRQRPARKGEQA